MLNIGYDIIPVRIVTRELEITIVSSKYPTPPLYTSNNIVIHCFNLPLSILMPPKILFGVKRADIRGLDPYFTYF